MIQGPDPDNQVCKLPNRNMLISVSLPACDDSTYLKVRCGGRGQVHLMEPLQSFGIALTAAAGHSSCSQTSYTLQTATHTHTTMLVVLQSVYLKYSNLKMFSEPHKDESCLLQSRLQKNKRLQSFVCCCGKQKRISTSNLKYFSHCHFAFS